jgi:hypothetical protein
MLHDPDRHEALSDTAWDEGRARALIARIVADTEARYTPERYWPLHPLDRAPDEDPSLIPMPLYFGAVGVKWALNHLQSVGAARLSRDPLSDLDTVLERQRRWLRAIGHDDDDAAYLMGDTPVLLMAHARTPTEALADRLALLIEGHIEHPTRELMWGSPGTLLAASVLHERTGDARWAELFRRTASRLWDQLETSAHSGCRLWSQDLYGRHSHYLDAVHGFAGTALPLIRGRHLLTDAAWQDWQSCIVDTVTRTATWQGDRVNWWPLDGPPDPPGRPFLMQFCHGSPGFVIMLAALPTPDIDALLLAAGRATWAAGPLIKGSNLCHGTGGNGYAFLKLYVRTGDTMWLQRARAFAMHGIVQTEAAAEQHGQMRYSLWTGDLGFAIYLWDCIHAQAAFPTLDVFDGQPHRDALAI